MTKLTSRALIAVVLIAVLSGCASGSRGRIASGLQSMGLAERPAVCVSDELADRLDKRRLSTVADLLDAARRAPETRPARKTLHRGLDLLIDAGDPMIAQSVATAGIACMISG